MGEYVAIKELPPAVQSALASVNYGRKDIEVITSPTVVLGDSGFGDGYQAFTTLVNLSDGRVQTLRGSWGGTNMFDRHNPVDNDDREYTLPQDGVAIKGQRGGTSPVWARLYIPASMRAKVLPAPTEDLPEGLRKVLACFKLYKSGDYRQSALRRFGGTPVVIDDLVARGLLSRNRAGAVQITTAGKNAVGDIGANGYIS